MLLDTLTQRSWHRFQDDNEKIKSIKTLSSRFEV